MRYFEANFDGVTKPKPLIPHVDACENCNGHGIIASENFPKVNNDYPNVAIIG